ncbi:MAG TPA: oligosaccharide flippase family protein [Planctomycetota bacterium]
MTPVPSRVWGATLLSALARQWSALCTLLSLAVLARALDAADFGRFTFYLAVLAFLDVLVDCGTSSAAVQQGASDARAFAAALAAGRRIRAVAALAGAALVGLTAGWAGERELPYVCLALLGPTARVAEMSAVAFQRDIAWGKPLLLRALGSTLRLGLIATLATRPGLGFGPYLLAHSAALALGNVAVHLAARPRLPAPAPPAPGFLRVAAPLAALGLVQQAYAWADNGFLRALAGPEELGRYNAAARPFLWLAFFAAFASTSALPWLARAAARAELGRATRALALPLVLGAALATGALLPWRAELLRLAFGPGFEAGATSLGWLLCALLPIALGATWLTAVIAAGRMRAALAVAAAALTVNLAANALLVPRLGAPGAALARLATESTVALGALAVLRRIEAWPLGAPKRFLLAPLVLALTWAGSQALHGALR